MMSNLLGEGGLVVRPERRDELRFLIDHALIHQSLVETLPRCSHRRTS
jgi:hypothetical protein